MSQVGVVFVWKKAKNENPHMYIPCIYLKYRYPIDVHECYSLFVF